MGLLDKFNNVMRQRWNDKGLGKFGARKPAPKVKPAPQPVEDLVIILPPPMTFEEVQAMQRKAMEQFEANCKTMRDGIDSRLLALAEAVGIPVHGISTPIVNGGFSALFSAGYYCTITDTVNLCIGNMVRHGFDANLVLAHELIHATGHHSRLDRGGVGYLTRAIANGANPFMLDPREDVSREERVAQFGASLLVDVLGVFCPFAERDTVNYLKRHGRACGTPDETDSKQAAEAVNYLLMRLKGHEAMTKGETHAKAS